MPDETPALPNTITRLREICLGFPEAQEKEFGGHTSPSFRVADKLFVMVNEAQTSLTLKAAPGAQAILVDAKPERFFVPSYVGPKGWVGVRLDGEIDWEELRGLIAESYTLIAPKRLRSQVT
jgi:predicted DNA-binding protein (MmcQ/YjbR family)